MLQKALSRQIESGELAGWSQRLGIFGLALWAFTAYQTLAGANLGLLLMVIAMVAQRRHVLDAVKGQAWFVWLCVFCVYLLGSALVAIMAMPEAGWSHWDATTRFFKLFLFIPVVAWWLGACPKRIAWVLALFVAGFLLEQFIETDLERWMDALAGQRIRMGMPENHVGFYSAVVITLLLALAPKFWVGQGQLWLRILKPLVWVVLLVSCAFLFYAGQSRAALVALVMIAPIILMVTAWPHLQVLRSGKRPVLVVIGGLCVAVLLMVMAQGSLERLREDMSGINLAQLAEELRNESQSPDSNNIKVRFALWGFGLEKWSERPLLGWGPGSSPVLLENASSEWVNRFADCHNMVIEFMLRFGIVGSALALAFFVAVFFSARRSLKEQHLSPTIFLIGVTGLALFFVAEQFNFWWLDPHARFFLLMFIGILIGPSLRGGVVPVVAKGRDDTEGGAARSLQI